MIVPNFVFTFQFFNLPRDYMYRGLKNNNNKRVWWPSKQPAVNCLNTLSLLTSFSQLQWKNLGSFDSSTSSFLSNPGNKNSCIIWRGQRNFIPFPAHLCSGLAAAWPSVCIHRMNRVNCHNGLAMTTVLALLLLLLLLAPSWF